MAPATGAATIAATAAAATLVRVGLAGKGGAAAAEGPLLHSRLFGLRRRPILRA